MGRAVITFIISCSASRGQCIVQMHRSDRDADPTSCISYNNSKCRYLSVYMFLTRINQHILNMISLSISL